ncbi:hypothetical protein Syun_001691 [Stephania yunnanensis]|uniref:Uncharacterized protein n=1 Tax=Stephania yunnanensis TaxID=152371 RepID=A0AAP0LED6_9MAGN
MEKENRDSDGSDVRMDAMDGADLVEGASVHPAKKGEGKAEEAGRRVKEGGEEGVEIGGGGEADGAKEIEEGRQLVQRERKIEKISKSVLVVMMESKPTEEGMWSVQRGDWRMRAK